MKNTKKSLVLSIVTLLLCSCMFIGSTFAWFTDTVSNTGNKIQAGTLDVDLLQRYNTMSDAQKAVVEGTPADKEFVSLDTEDLSAIGIFDYDKWEPGYTSYKVLKIVNKGNLALKFNLQFIAKDEVKSPARLADVIDVYTKIHAGTTTPVTDPTTFDEAALLNAGFVKTTLSELIDDLDGGAHGYMIPSGELAGSPSGYDCYIVMHMREDAGNDYQGLKVGYPLDIKLNATQYTYEKDGFGSDQYDKDAVIPWNGLVDEEGLEENTNKDDKVVIIESADQLAAFAQKVNSGISYNDYTISLQSDIDLNNIPWTPINAFPNSNTYLLVGTTFDGNGHSINNLFVNSSATSGYRSAFFGSVPGNITIKNLTFNNAKIDAPETNQVAVVIGMEFADATLENVVINNSEINGLSKAGALVGATDGNGKTITVKNCEVNNTNVNANYAYATVVGFVNINDSVVISGTKVNNSKATFVPNEDEFKGESIVKYEGIDFEILNDQIWHIGGEQNGSPLWASKRSNPAPTTEIDGHTYTIKGDKFLIDNGTLSE